MGESAVSIYQKVTSTIKRIAKWIILPLLDTISNLWNRNHVVVFMLLYLNLLY
jgi:hypothetical protein